MPTILVLSMLLASGVSSAHRDPETLVRAFAAGWRSGDVAAMKALWTPSPTASRFNAAFARRQRLRCVTALRVETGPVTIDRDTATAHVSFDLDEEPASPRAARRYTSTGGMVRLTRTSDGWRVSAYDADADLFAESLMDGDPIEKLRGHEEMLTPELPRALARLAMQGINRGDRPKAKQAIDRASMVASMIGDDAALGAAMAINGSIQSATGTPEAFLATLQKAYALAEGSGDIDSMARIRNYMGRPYEHNGDLAAAESQYRQALALRDEVEDPLLADGILNSMNLLTYQQSDLAASLMYANQIVHDSFEDGNVLGTYSPEISIASVYQRENDHELAMLHARLCLERATAAKNDQFRGRALMILGNEQLATGNLDAAVRTNEEALQLARSIDDRLAVGEILRYRGIMAYRQKKYDEAERWLTESLDTFEKIHRVTYLSTVLSLIAWTKHAAGRDPQEVIKAAMRAAEVSLNTDDIDSFTEAKTLLGVTYRNLGDHEKALAAYAGAIEGTERMRHTVGGDTRQQLLYFQQFVLPYTEMIELLAGEGKVAEALAYAERAKGRVLFDVLRNGKQRSSSSMTAEEHHQESALDKRLTSLNRELLGEQNAEQPDGAKIAALEQQVRDARLAFESFEAELNTAHNRLQAERADFPAATAGELAGILPDARSAMLEFVITSDRTYMFVLSKRRLRVHVIHAGKEALEKKVAAFSASLSQRDLNFRDYSRTLGQLLLGPAAEELKGVRTLCVIPDGTLWNVPFEALSLRNGRYLIEDHAVFYAPSMTVLREIERHRNRRPAERTLLAVGNPAVTGRAAKNLTTMYRGESLAPLPDAESEVRQLRRLYGADHSTILTGHAALESAIKPQMERYRILHFATHARVDDSNPMYSYLVLAGDERQKDDDGLLEAWEIAKMDLTSDLTVLSACDTARGRLGAGEGIIGMSWALFIAGCPSSVVSHWKVSSASTAHLMVAFHKSLLAMPPGALAKTEALRTAKLQLLHSTKYRHPFYWSAFVLIGAPR